MIQRATWILHLEELDKVKQYHRGEAQKKASMEARVKPPVQLYLVCMGLSKPHNALGNVEDIHQCQQRLESEHQHHREPQGCAECLVSCSSAIFSSCGQPQKHLSAVDYEETQDLIKPGALLQAHWKLMDLECSQDGLIHEQPCKESANMHNMTIIHDYFRCLQ